MATALKGIELALYVTTWAMLFISWAIVSWRFYVRFGNGFNGWDDGLMLIAMVIRF